MEQASGPPAWLATPEDNMSAAIYYGSGQLSRPEPLSCPDADRCEDYPCCGHESTVTAIGGPLAT